VHLDQREGLLEENHHIGIALQLGAIDDDPLAAVRPAVVLAEVADPLLPVSGQVRRNGCSQPAGDTPRVQLPEVVLIVVQQGSLHDFQAG